MRQKLTGTGTGTDNPGTRKPSLRTEEPPTLRKMSGFGPYASQSAAREASPQTGLLQPFPQGVSIRRTSNDTTTLRPALNGSASSSSVPSIGAASPAGIENESPVPWSSAVGHATTSGKSGRVIERLMAENDKLKRELELANLRAQELEKSLSMYRPQMEALRNENENLSHVRDVDLTLIGRRDRKIEELKADNVAKDERLRKLEAHAKELQRNVEGQREEHAREMQSMLEQTKHASVNAEIWETSHKQLRAEYKARRDQWEHDLKEIKQQREHDRQRMARLDVVCEQLRQEHERGGKIQTEMLAKWTELEQVMRSTAEQAEASTEAIRRRGEDMLKAVEDMRWVMNLSKNAAFRKESKDHVVDQAAS